MEILSEPDVDFLWDVVRDCSYATFYHTPVWHQIAEGVAPAHQSRPVGARLDNGTRVVLPLLKIRPMLSRYVSTFAGCYGGLVADGPIPEGDATTLFRHVFSQSAKTFKFISNPIKEETRLPDLSSGEVEEDFTQILTLDGSLDDIVSGYSRGHRSSLKKARREGVTVRPATSKGEYRSYFGAYEASLDRWGKDPSEGYSWELFEAAYELSKEHPDLITLWLALVDEEVASGALIFSWNQHVSYWHGAAHEEYFDYRPNNLLHTEIIREALEDGYRYYDFNPSGGYEGVVSFKSRFGAEKWPLTRHTYARNILETVLGS